MAQRQNSFAALLAALTLAPQFVHSAEQSGATNEQKHANVANGIAAVAQIGGALAAAQNPAYAALIDAAIKLAVGLAKQNNFAQPQPIAMVPVAALPDDHPVAQAAATTTAPGVIGHATPVPIAPSASAPASTAPSASEPTK